MSLKAKLILVFDVVLVLVALQAAVALILLAQTVAQSERLVTPALDRVDLIAHAEADALRLRTLELSYLSLSESHAQGAITAEMRSLEDAIQRRLTQYAALPSDEPRASVLAEARRVFASYSESLRQIARLVELQDRDGALSAYLGHQPEFAELDERLHTLRHLEYRAIEAMQVEMRALAERWQWVLIAAIVIVAVANHVLGLYLNRAISRSLGSLQASAARLASEDFDTPVGRPPEPELALLADALERSRVGLAEGRDERRRLETERARLARERLGAIVRAQEDERARIARELHDQAAQSLTALRYRLAHLQQLSNDPTMRDEVARLIDLSSETGRQIAQQARDLRPAAIDDLGLVPALRGCAREFAERTGVEIAFSSAPGVPRLSRDAELATFRIVQEALTNVAKHACATRCQVSLDSDAQEMTITVRDDGRGFDATCAAPIPSRNGAEGVPGLGLIGMRERVDLLGGSVSITSSAGAGTVLVATIPLRAATGADTTA